MATEAEPSLYSMLSDRLGSVIYKHVHESCTFGQQQSIGNGGEESREPEVTKEFSGDYEIDNLAVNATVSSLGNTFQDYPKLQAETPKRLVTEKLAKERSRSRSRARSKQEARKESPNGKERRSEAPRRKKTKASQSDGKKKSTKVKSKRDTKGSGKATERHAKSPAKKRDATPLDRSRSKSRGRSEGVVQRSRSRRRSASRPKEQRGPSLPKGQRSASPTKRKAGTSTKVTPRTNSRHKPSPRRANKSPELSTAVEDGEPEVFSAPKTSNASRNPSLHSGQTHSDGQTVPAANRGVQKHPIKTKPSFSNQSVFEEGIEMVPFASKDGSTGLLVVNSGESLVPQPTSSVTRARKQTGKRTKVPSGRHNAFAASVRAKSPARGKKIISTASDQQLDEMVDTITKFKQTAKRLGVTEQELLRAVSFGSQELSEAVKE